MLPSYYSEIHCSAFELFFRFMQMVSMTPSHHFSKPLSNSCANAQLSTYTLKRTGCFYFPTELRNVGTSSQKLGNNTGCLLWADGLVPYKDLSIVLV